jgi:hypothetical protein
MHTKECAMCDKENRELSARDWCNQCEIEFAQVMQTVQCANRTNVCDSPFTCLTQKKCVQVRAVTITSSQVYQTRERLREMSAKRSFLGVIAAETKIPEYALRDWVENPSHFLTHREMQLVIEALDRYVSSQSAIEGTAASQ